MKKPLLHLLLYLLLQFSSFVHANAQKDTFEVAYPELLKGLDSMGIVNFDNTDVFTRTTLDNGTELIKGVSEVFPSIGKPFLSKIEHKWYVTYSGSGIVFHLSNDYQKAIRIDKSIINGFNYEQFAVIVPNSPTIHTIGGYGFWNFNSTLRFYNNNNKTWDFVSLTWPQEEYIVDARFGFVQSGNKGIYLAKLAKRSSRSNEYDATSDCFIIQYDSHLVSFLGKLNPKLMEAKFMCQSQNGIIVREQQQLYFLDFVRNIYWTLSSNFFTDNLSIDWFTSFNKNKLFYLDKDRFAVFDLETSKWALKKIKQSEWQEVEEPLIITEKKYNKIFYTLLIISILFVILISIKSIAYKKNNPPSQTIIASQTLPANGQGSISIQPEVKAQSYWYEQLSETERELLRTILNNHNHASLDQINRILGVQDKSSNVQKFHRHKIITDLNNSYSLVYAVKEDLIVRTKSEEDKRIFNYSINEAYLEDLKIGCSPSL